MICSGTIKKLSLALILLIASSVFENSFSRVGVERGYLASTEQEAGQPSNRALAHAFGEFRIVAANMIWLNVVDRYHHEFMEQGGAWSRNASLLPFIRMITWLDPHFIEAYDVAGAILPSLHQFDEGQRFLDEGIKNNPSNWQLYYDLAMLHAWYQRDAKAALPYARKARELATDPFYKRRLSMLVRGLEQDVAKGVSPVSGG
ncbi:MAG: hypothetical protein P4L33_09330 [Capsulimonadaceae bacterium]|nr:hypothetical protein [Capsulimonadaceae bacterium]